MRISKKGVHVFRITNIVTNIIMFIALGGLIWSMYYFNWYGWIKILLWISLGMMLCVAIWSVMIRPTVIYKHWRYGVDENFIRLKYGKLNQTDAIIPMTKVQYVEAEQGPILRKFSLYSLTIGTMSSSHKIPALPKDEAFDLRDQIAHHAKINEVDDSNEA